MKQVETKNNLEALNKVLLVLHKALQGINYFPMAGKLLGLIRDGQLISWDTDIDLASTEDTSKPEVRDRIMNKLKPHFPSAGKTASSVGWGEEGCVFGCMNRGQPSVSMQFFRNMGDYMREVNTLLKYPVEPFKKFKTIKYLGKDFKVPKNPDKLLEFWYGDKWRIPARGVWVEENIVIEDQHLGYRMQNAKEVFVECKVSGEIVYPLNILSTSRRQKILEGIMK